MHSNADFNQFQAFQQQQWENFQTFQKQQWEQFHTFARNHGHQTPQEEQTRASQFFLPQQPQYPHYYNHNQYEDEEDSYFSPIINRYREPQQFEEQHPLRWLFNIFENQTRTARPARRVYFPVNPQNESDRESDPIIAEIDEPEVEEPQSESQEASNRWIEFLKYLHNKNQQSTQKQESPQQPKKEEVESQTQTGNPLDFLGGLFQGFKKQEPAQKGATKSSPQFQPTKTQPAKRDSQIPVRPVEKPLSPKERLNKIASEFENIKNNLSNTKPKTAESKLMNLLTGIDDIHCEDENQKSFRHKLAKEINGTIESLIQNDEKNSEIKVEPLPESVIPNSSDNANVSVPVTSSEPEIRSIPVKQAPTVAETLDSIESEYSGLSEAISNKSIADKKSIKATESKLNKLLVTLDELHCPDDLRPRKKELVKNINNAIENLFNIEAKPISAPEGAPVQVDNNAESVDPVTENSQGIEPEVTFTESNPSEPEVTFTESNLSEPSTVEEASTGITSGSETDISAEQPVKNEPEPTPSEDILIESVPVGDD